MVARRKLEDFGSPVGDGLPVREIAPHSTQKTHYLWKFADTAALATSRAFKDKRVYADLYASCGFCKNKETGALGYGSALLALLVTKPFDLYFLNDLDPKMTSALAQRVKALGIPGAVVFELDTRQDDAFARCREIANVLTFGPKVVISTCSANDVGGYLRELMRPFGKHRYINAFIDPFSAGYHWSAFEELSIYERWMDVIALFPTRMDLGRNFTYYRNSDAGKKLDDYFGCEWRDIVDANPQHAEHDLRVLYEQRMRTILGFNNIGHPKGVGFNKAPLYHLIFGSKGELGMKLWNDVNRRDAFEQEELWLDGA